MTPGSPDTLRVLESLAYSRNRGCSAGGAWKALQSLSKQMEFTERMLCSMLLGMRWLGLTGMRLAEGQEGCLGQPGGLLLSA